jgi:hypothetical protein
MREAGTCRCGRGTLYDVLQVSPWCEPEVIQAAYRALARTRHPDVNRDPDAEEQMRRLNVAYQTLSDPARRMRYDEELALEAARPIVARPAPSPSAAPAWSAPAPTATRQRPGAASAVNGVSAAPTVVSPAAAYQPTIFDAGGNMMLPRSAIYVSLLMVTVILALVAWLILDTLAQRPLTPSRLPRVSEQSRSVQIATLGWRIEDLSASVQPGLSPSGARWNE